MPTCEGRASVVLATLLLAYASPGGRTPAAPPLKLQVVLDKTDFFKGEPIYAMFELSNVGSDTVRIPPFVFNTNGEWFVGVLRHGNGTVVPGGRNMFVDYICPHTCNDDPVAPGGVRYLPFIVQELWGERGPLSHTTLYNNLDTGAYALDGSFRLDGPDRSTPAVASPVVFRVRPRRPQEDTAYQQFARLGTVDVRAWTVVELDSALAWISRRLAGDSADPFALKVLIWSDAHTRVMRQRVDTTELVRMFQLELAIAEAQARSPAGALAAEHLYRGGRPRYRDPRLPLCSTLAGTIAGDVACEREAQFARVGKARPPN